MKKIYNWLIWPIVLIPFIYLAYTWSELPEQVAVHFNLKGEPDRFGNKNQLIYVMLLITGIGLAIYYLLPLVYKIDPKKTAIDNQSRLRTLAFFIAIFMSFVSCLIINSAINNAIKLNIHWMFGAMGLFWCILGNYLYNIKPNYFAGYRLPWTLSNEDNWKKTHRLAAKLLFAGGLLIFLCALLLKKDVLIFTVITIACISTIIPIFYSYNIYRQQKTLNGKTS